MHWCTPKADRKTTDKTADHCSEFLAAINKNRVDWRHSALRSTCCYISTKTIRGILNEQLCNDTPPNYVIAMNHAYPQQLATFVSEHWDQANADQSADELPSLPLLELIISTCYQASLMREEQIPVTCRVMLCNPNRLPESAGPPAGLHRLVFDDPRPFSSHELRRLSSAASFHRSLIGVDPSGTKGPVIWGIVHSGPRWLQSLHGGRGTEPAMPAVPVINVTGPGHIEFLLGAQTVGQLSEGHVFGPSMNVFLSNWMHDQFSVVRGERMALHAEHRSRANNPWSELDPAFTAMIDQHTTKRLIAAIRAFHHGGTLIMIPPERGQEISEPNPWLSLRYTFQQGEPRARFRSLIIRLMNRLAELGHHPETEADSNRMVGWEDYVRSNDPEITELDEAIFEMSHLIAGLTTVDGAVVVTKRFEVLGFGAEIRSDLSDVLLVARAMDLEGERFKVEQTYNVGTRHSSAYRLCHEMKDVLAIVVSQDGGVRFVRWEKGHVMYWDHKATFSFTSRF